MQRRGIIPTRAAQEGLAMDNPGPQLLIAHILAHGDRQRLPQEQTREHLCAPDRALPSRTDPLRSAIAGALIALGKRIGGSEVASPLVPADPQGTIRPV